VIVGWFGEDDQAKENVVSFPTVESSTTSPLIVSDADNEALAP